MVKKLLDYIENSDFYKKEFVTWEATEQIIDDKKAFWMLKKPGSQCRKVCLYRDGCNMFVYGDYGQFTFDSMTWLGSVYNLEYDNIGYQMEKMNYDSKQSIRIYDEDICRKDILDWLIDVLEDDYKDNQVLAKKIYEFCNEKYYLTDSEIEQFCSENKLDIDTGLIRFVSDCLDHTDEYEWIAFLRESNLSDFDEVCESELWHAGKVIHQRYFICMYALQVCGEKLKKDKENN